MRILLLDNYDSFTWNLHHLLEPFALDLWRNEVLTWLPETVRAEQIRKETYFGGLYQIVEVTGQA